MEYKLRELITAAKENEVQINYQWYPARPVQATGWLGLKTRLKGAWKVFTGKADTVIWPAGQ